MSNSINSPKYGYLDTSLKAAGGESGLRQLCTDFYQLMDTLNEAKIIRDMHKENLELMSDKLTLFLIMWLGGPKTYVEKYGSTSMPMAHKNFVINKEERDAWLLCMDQAVEKQEFEDSFKAYLKKQFRFPAQMIMNTSKNE